MKEPEHVIKQLHLFHKTHPAGFVREKHEQLHVINITHLSNCKDGQVVKVAGLVLAHQRLGTAKAVCFMTIEDEIAIRGKGATCNCRQVL